MNFVIVRTKNITLWGDYTTYVIYREYSKDKKIYVKTYSSLGSARKWCEKLAQISEQAVYYRYEKNADVVKHYESRFGSEE